MNIVIISEYATRELYVIEQIIKEYPSATVVRPVYPTSSDSDKNTNDDKNIFDRIKKLADAVSWKLHRTLWDRKFYPDRNIPNIPNIIEIPESKLHSPAGIETVDVLSPDILITCRSPLLKPELFNLAEKAAINIHYGVAPYYRGNDTLFWPLYYDDFDHLGGSIHHLTEGVDTGNIVAEVYPSLTPWDGEINVDFKTSRLLAKALLEFLKTAERNNSDLSGKPQLVKGRNFKSADRTHKKSLEYLCKRAIGLSRPPRRDERMVTHFSSRTKSATAPSSVVL